MDTIKKKTYLKIFLAALALLPFIVFDVIVIRKEPTFFQPTREEREQKEMIMRIDSRLDAIDKKIDGVLKKTDSSRISSDSTQRMMKDFLNE